MRSILSIGCLLALSASVSTTGCAIIVTGSDDVQVKSVFSTDAVAGDGRLAKDVRDVRAIGNVSAIDVSGPLEVNVRVGPSASLEVEADGNLLPMIRTEVVNGVLRMWIEGSVRPANSLRITCTLVSLTEASASGSGRLTIGELNGAPLNFSKSGSGAANLSGRVSRLDVRHSGSGAINAGALRTGEANLALIGSGRMSLGPLQGSALTVSLHGSGSLQASGTVASLTARVQGSGSADLAALASEQADLAIDGSGDITARVTRALIAQSTGSGRITVYGDPAQRKVSGKHVLVLN